MATKASGSVFKNSGNFLEFLSKNNPKTGFTEFEQGGKGTKPGGKKKSAAVSTYLKPMGLTETGPAGDTAVGGTDDPGGKKSIGSAKKDPNAGAGSAATGGQTPYGDIFGYSQPGEALKYWLRQNITNGGKLDQNDPFVQFMGRMTSGIPYLYDAIGAGGEQGAAGFTDFLGSIVNAMRSTDQGDYSNSPLYNLSELQGLIGAITGGGFEGDNINQQNLAKALETLSAEDASSMFMDILASAGVTSMTPLALNVLMQELQGDYEAFAGDEQFAAGNETPTGNSFWRFLQSQGDLLGKYF